MPSSGLYTLSPTTTCAGGRVSAVSRFRFFKGFNLIEPGLVRLGEWRPASVSAAGGQPERIAGYGGVGCKR